MHAFIFGGCLETSSNDYFKYFHDSNSDRVLQLSVQLDCFKHFKVYDCFKHFKVCLESK